MGGYSRGSRGSVEAQARFSEERALTFPLLWGIQLFVFEELLCLFECFLVCLRIFKVQQGLYPLTQNYYLCRITLNYLFGGSFTRNSLKRSFFPGDVEGVKSIKLFEK